MSIYTLSNFGKEGLLDSALMEVKSG